VMSFFMAFFFLGWHALTVSSACANMRPDSGVTRGVPSLSQALYFWLSGAMFSRRSDAAAHALK
jgi:hypothetical protein